MRMKELPNVHESARISFGKSNVYESEANKKMICSYLLVRQQHHQIRTIAMRTIRTDNRTYATKILYSSILYYKTTTQKYTNRLIDDTTLDVLCFVYTICLSRNVTDGRKFC